MLLFWGWGGAVFISTTLEFRFGPEWKLFCLFKLLFKKDVFGQGQDGDFFQRYGEVAFW